MKKVFMPSMDELYKMQDMGADIKLYLYAKAIEALCIEYNNYPKKGSILKNEFKYIRENEMLNHAICMMYPSEIEYSNVARYDTRLLQTLLEDTKYRSLSQTDRIISKNDIYRLDNISRFTTCTSEGVLPTVIDILAAELPINPKYRFEYRQSTLNSILDDIFMGKIRLADIKYCMSDIEKEKYLSLLAKIEPFYVMQRDDEETKKYYMRQAVVNYINRYGFDFTVNISKKDILTNQDTEVKRLFRCIKRK